VGGTKSPPHLWGERKNENVIRNIKRASPQNGGEEERGEECPVVFLKEEKKKKFVRNGGRLRSYGKTRERRDLTAVYGTHGAVKKKRGKRGAMKVDMGHPNHT